MRQAVDIALRAAIAIILGEASKYSDSSERDYRQGMQHAAGLLDRIVSGKLKASVQ